MSSFSPELFSRFFLIDRIAVGSIAEVFLASEFKSNNEDLFVVKRLLPEYAGNKLFAQRLLDEANLYIHLKHPNIAKVFEVGSIENHFFIKMEWLDGKSLAQIFEKLRQSKGLFPRRPLYYILEQVSECLKYVHDSKDSFQNPLNVVHKDLTPQNILVGYDGSVKVSDFAVAAFARREIQFPTEVLLNNLPYFAPEQVARKAIDRRADIYSLGVVLYEGVTLRKPFLAQTISELEKKILDFKPDIEPFALDPLLSELVYGCLKKDPELRFPSASHILKKIGKLGTENGKQLLSELVKELFSKEHESEKQRKEIGIWALKNKRTRPEDLLDGLSHDIMPSHDPTEPELTERQERTDSRHQSDLKTDIDLDRPSQEKSKTIGKIDLAKRDITKVVKTIDWNSDLLKAEPLESKDVIQEDLSEAPQNFDFSLKSISKKKQANVSKSFSSKLFNQIPSLVKVTIVLITLSSIIFLFSTSNKIQKHEHNKTTPIIKIKNVSELMLFPTIEGSPEKADQEAIDTWLTPSKRDLEWLQKVSRFFSQEYLKHTGKVEPFQLKIFDPKAYAPKVSWEGNIFYLLSPFNTLSRFLKIPKEIEDSKEVRVFIHLYPKALEERPRYPLDHAQKRPKQQGIIYIPLTPKEDYLSRIRLAHEIAHALGATDKYGKGGMAVYPEGYAEPFKEPLYPQEYGELMSRGVVQNETSYRLFKSLDEVKIGLKTAAELGWINEIKARKFYESRPKKNTQNVIPDPNSEDRSATNE